MLPPPETVLIRYPVSPSSADAWVIPEGTVPESIVHDQAAEALRLVLEFWAAQRRPGARIARSFAVRFYEEDWRKGIDPDVCVLDPAPPNLEELGSLCLWKPGHTPPSICFEVVSLSHPNKDYTTIQDRYAVMRCKELVVFDPTLAGPKSTGGPVLLQLWRRSEAGAFERVHFANYAVYSEVLEAWLVPEGRRLLISEDERGTWPWPTEAEHAQRQALQHQADAERAQADAERAQADAERAQADAERAQADAERLRRSNEALQRELAELKARLGER
jgi:hypothetical protein